MSCVAGSVLAVGLGFDPAAIVCSNVDQLECGQSEQLAVTGLSGKC